MKQYKIGNKIVRANNVVDAVRKVKDANITPEELRRFCIKYNYYTSGTINEYDNLLMNASKWDLREIASDIAAHSKGVWSTEVFSKLKETFRDSCKDATYQFPELTEKDLDALKKYNLKIKGRAGSDIIVEGSLADLKLYARNYLDYDLHPDYIGDEDIKSLSKEEEQAIEDYKKAIAETKDPKLLRLFAHILKEEIEHLEELQSEEIVDTCKRK